MVFLIVSTFWLHLIFESPCLWMTLSDDFYSRGFSLSFLQSFGFEFVFCNSFSGTWLWLDGLSPGPMFLCGGFLNALLMRYWIYPLFCLSLAPCIGLIRPLWELIWRSLRFLCEKPCFPITDWSFNLGSACGENMLALLNFSQVCEIVWCIFHWESRWGNVVHWWKTLDTWLDSPADRCSSFGSLSGMTAVW